MMLQNDPDSRVNCCTCVKFDKEIQRRKDEKGVMQRYIDTPEFDKWDRQMRANKGVCIPP